jgi:methyl-accepting chemotaxis protein
MRITIGKKLFAAFGLIFALMIANAAVIYTRMADLRARQLTLAKVKIPAIETIDDIRIADQRMVNGLYGSIYSRSDVAATQVNLKQIEQSKQRATDDLATLQKFSASFLNMDYDKRVLAIGDGLSHLILTCDEIETLLKGKSLPSAAAVHALNTEAIPSANKVRDLSKDLIAKVNESTEADNLALDKSGQIISWMLLLSTGTLLLLGGLFSWRITRGIVVPLTAVVERAEAIADGDLLGAEIQDKSTDEVASLTVAVNKMQQSLAGTLQAVASAADQVAGASEELSANAAESAAGADTQKDQVHQIAAAMQEMSATLRDVSHNSQNASNLAANASQTARDGGVIVGETLASMQALAAFVKESAANVKALGSRSEEIGRIIGVIDDIADQTNLLALNAAIEAARAGEQGRGFAVVADEVRKLAERTSKATKEITAMIEAIQKETGAAVEKMHSGTEQVERGVTATNRAGESLQQIIEQAARVGDMIAHIAAATTEQSTTTEQVNRNMEQISQLVADSANGARQSAMACEQLSNSAMEMQHLVGRFKLNHEPRGSLTPSSAVALLPRARAAAAGAEDSYS